MKYQSGKMGLCLITVLDTTFKNRVRVCGRSFLHSMTTADVLSYLVLWHARAIRLYGKVIAHKLITHDKYWLIARTLNITISTTLDKDNRYSSSRCDAVCVPAMPCPRVLTSYENIPAPSHVEHAQDRWANDKYVIHIQLLCPTSVR